MALTACDVGPVDWRAFTERTVSENLASIEAATERYNAALATGGMDAACSAARDYLVAQTGVAGVTITQDSLVWAFFDNGLLAGLGDPIRPLSGLGAESETTIRASAGGEAGDLAQNYVIPFPTELPGTSAAATYIKSTFLHRLDWENSSEFKGAAVDIAAARQVLTSDPGVLFWSGHGVMLPESDTTRREMPCLVLGVSYASRDAATAAILSEDRLFATRHGEMPLVATYQSARDNRYRLAITPAFVRLVADFNQPSTWPYYNYSRAFVYLSCCYSAYASPDRGRLLVEAFRSAGAALVVGYDWAVHDEWSEYRDESFFLSLADTCMPMEAMRGQSSLTDPLPVRGGNATWTMVGDTLAMLQPVFQAKIDGAPYRPMPSLVGVTRGDPCTATTTLRLESNTGRNGTIQLAFPGQPSTYNVTQTENASVAWIDNQTQKVYVSGTNMVGVDFTITVNKVQDDALVCHFSGRVGYWTSGNPYETPPNQTVTFSEGIIKYTGRIVGGQPDRRERGGFAGWATAAD
jgi:hypothetical protein